jgi:hypothetical protein
MKTILNGITLVPEHAFFHLPSSRDALTLYPESKIFYIDGNRVDVYVEDGSISRPFKTFHAAVAASTGGVGYAYVIAPGSYTEADPVTLPNVPIVIEGNDATITWTGGITVQNPNYARYDLNSIGNVIFSGSTPGRVVVQGGSIVGNITLNGLTDFKSCGLAGGVVTANATAQVLAIVCTITSRLVSTGQLFIEQCNMNRTDNANPLISSTGGFIAIVNSILQNLGSGGGISCANGATTVPNLITSNVITVASGAPVACGTAVTVYCKNMIGGGLNTGTGYVPVSSDIIGPSILALGSDATGDIYYRAATTGALTRLALGPKGSVVRSSGTIPEYATQYEEITGASGTLQYNKMHGANNVGLVTLTLPATAAVGERFSVIGVGAGGWKIAQNAGQSIQKEATTTTVGTGGSVAGAQGTSVEVVCVEADTKWIVSYSSGTLTLV